MAKLYFRGGKGIKNPVDFNGEPIYEGNLITHSWFDFDYIEFFNKYTNLYDLNEIERRVNKPSYIVKYNEEGGFYFGEGIEDTLYMHDFSFKYCKKIKTQ